MGFTELKQYIKNNVDVSKKIYICDFFSCNNEKMKNVQISLVKNVFGKFVVTKWIDYEYGKYSHRSVFRDKNMAANYAWELFKRIDG